MPITLTYDLGLIVPKMTEETNPNTPVDSDSQASEQAAPNPPEPVSGAGNVAPAKTGPLSLAKIREMRKSQQKATIKKPAPIPAAAGDSPPQQSIVGKNQKSKSAVEVGVIRTQEPSGAAPKIEVPSVRHPLSKDLEDELEAALGGTDLDNMLVGDEMLQVGKILDEGQRIQAKVMKAQGEHVFVSLGGPNEGVIPALQFEDLPEAGTLLDVVVRGYLVSEGLYEVTVPGAAVDVSDWSDLSEGEVIEATVSGANTGGLEGTVGAIRGFIPASQVAEYRVENLEDMVGEKVLCVVTEANPRRGNLVLSRRAVLEREKAEKREERLANLEVGASVDGVVRKILDFGAFVDIGGLDGLLHISQLSWDRVKHPSEILEEGQNIKVRVDKIDPQSGKIGLSYRSLEDHPWNDIDSRFPVGSIIKGTVTRIAEFGAFVKIAPGVEGLVHLSELAHHRVNNVGNVVKEDQEVDVKVLSMESDQQRISLSIKGAVAAPEGTAESGKEEVEEPRPDPVLPKHRGPLKGGVGKASGGDQFGLKW